MKRQVLLIGLVVFISGIGPTAGAAKRPASGDDFVPLFDGKTLEGWEGDPERWKVEDGAIVGTNDGTLKHNTFLCTKKTYGDFVLKVSIKLEGGNSGVQFRSTQHENFVVSGYQADAAPEYWGMLYDERGRGILKKPNQKLLRRAKVKENGWNDYVITARGNRISLKLNGVNTVSLVDPEGAKEGIIALQIHTGPAMKVSFKDIAINELD